MDRPWKRAWALVFAILAWVCSSIRLPAFAQNTEPQASSQDASPQPQQPKRGPFFNVDEFAFQSQIEYYAPLAGFDRQNRDIDIQLTRVALAAHLPSGWEFMFDAFGFHADGNRTEPSNPTLVESNAVGVGAGPMVRWNFLQLSRLRLFLNADGSLLLADRPFPQRGAIYDFFLRAGGGVSVRVSDSYWIESAFDFAHISNGKGLESANPTWQGDGIALGLRHTFGRKREGTPGAPEKALLSVFRKADGGAWVSGAEYYAPLPGSMHKAANFQGDIRAIRISRAWHFPNRVEFQLGGMIQKTDAATGLGALWRWNFLDRKRVRLFVDAGGDFLQLISPGFLISSRTVSGLGYTGFLRAGGGASWRLHRSYWIEGDFRWAHVPAGFGSGTGSYPEWTGQGGSVSLRHTF
jgi:hypothetical protein